MARATRLIPHRARRALRARFGTWPPRGLVRLGSLRRLTPVSRRFGYDRGTPIDRYYIERFLARYGGAEDYAAGDIRGRVLEVGDDMYTRKFGDPPPEAGSPARGGGVENLDVLHVSADNPQATVVGDLATGDGIASDSFDCVICTQTLHVIYDVRGAIRTLHRMLAPGGVLLATFPGITQSCQPDKDLWGDYWRFTTRSARRLFEEVFEPEKVTVEAYGNVLTAVAFMHGLAAEELRWQELDLRDPDYEVLVAVRAVK